MTTRISSSPIRFATCLLCYAACESEPHDAETHITRDSSGIQIIESRSAAWGEDAVRLDTVPVIRVGKEQEGPYQLTSVPFGLLFDDHGFAAAEARAMEIRLFDSAGSHLRTSGRVGNGPGEFRNIAGAFRYRGDSLAVYDQRLRRTTFVPFGAGASRTVANEASGNLLVFGVSESGHVLLYNPGSGFRPDLAPGLQWDTTGVVIMDPEDGASRTVARLPSRQQFVEADGNTRPVVPAHGSIQAVGAHEFYWATTDRYEIRSYSTEGVLTRILRRPIEPRAVEPHMIDRHIEANLAIVRRFEGEAAVPRYRQTFEERTTYGDQIPLFGTAFVDADDRLWVSESIWPELQGSPRRWSVFSPEGILLADLEVPDRARIVDSNGDFVLAVWRDEFDVPYVQIHRLLHD